MSTSLLVNIVLLVSINGCVFQESDKTTSHVISPLQLAAAKPDNEQSEPPPPMREKLQLLPQIPARSYMNQPVQAMTPGVVMMARFEFGSKRLSNHTRLSLDSLAEQLHQQGWYGRRIFIHGHTDSTGDTATNFVLSQQRAQMVMNYLQQRTSVPKERFEAIGFGELVPLVDNSTPQKRMLNRRVEVRISL